MLTPDQDTLSHHGVPGMRWGVTTKEYVKKGYNTLKRRQAILKQKRKAEAKAQYEEGYHRGQRVASNLWFVKDRANAILKKKREQEEGSLSDRAVSKAADYVLKKTKLDKKAKEYGLDQYIPKAKDFLKDKKNDLLDNVYEYIQTENGQIRLQKIANLLARGVSVSARAGSEVARAASKGGKIARKAVKSAAKAAGSGIKAGYKWLREGDPSGAEKIHRKVRSGEKVISKYGNAASEAFSKSVQSIHRGAKSAHKQMNQLLAKRHRRAS